MQLTVSIDVPVKDCIKSAMCYSWWTGWEVKEESDVLKVYVYEDPNPGEEGSVIRHLVKPNQGFRLILETDARLALHVIQGDCSDACDKFLQYAVFGELRYG